MQNNESVVIGESLSQIRHFRNTKLKKLIELGFDPYPARVRRDKEIKLLKENFSDLKDSSYFVVGRVIGIRSYGKLAFLDVADESSKLQVILMKNKDLIEIDGIKSLTFSDAVSLIDSGDFIETHGLLTESKTGEISILADSIRIITKSLRPIPENLDDIETRQRKRYLDILVNTEVKARYERRSRFWQANRDFLNSRGFIELNCPILEHTTGGADANPFLTHMDAIDQDFYLRISHELPLKRLIGAGFEKVYDLGARFRNEGFSDEHLPEHMAIEWYWAYVDYREGMKMMEEMFRYMAEKTWGKLKFESKGFNIDFSKKWEVIDYASIIKERFGIDIFNTTKEEIESKLGEKVESISRGVDKLWKKIRITIEGPAWLIGEPVFMSPLAKPSIENPLVSERFHPVIAGSELGNGYSELNDPTLQLLNFEDQQTLREDGDNEAQMLDLDFVEMLEYGMPPTCGWGHSERVFWFLENVSAREGVLFPPMKEFVENKDAKKKSIKVAHIVLNTSQEVDLENWQILNTIAHVSTMFGIRQGKILLYQDEITTKDGEQLKLNSQYAIMIRECKENGRLNELISEAKRMNIPIYPFTREMIVTSDDKKVIEMTRLKDFSDLEILGVLFFGEKEEMNDFLKEFALIK